MTGTSLSALSSIADSSLSLNESAFCTFPHISSNESFQLSAATAAIGAKAMMPATATLVIREAKLVTTVEIFMTASLNESYSFCQEKVFFFSVHPTVPLPQMAGSFVCQDFEPMKPELPAVNEKLIFELKLNSSEPYERI
ncbi:MAG: hypothetical protein M0042_11670 [Nitrospiraceae bacterium]|nr:hypothetical protein [Nitrospiraceae bacterium]